MVQGSDLPQILTNVHTKLSAALYSPKTQGRIPEAGANPPFSERMHYWLSQQPGGSCKAQGSLSQGSGRELGMLSQTFSSTEFRLRPLLAPAAPSVKRSKGLAMEGLSKPSKSSEQFWAVRDGVEVAAPSFFVHLLLLHCIPAVTHLKRCLGAGRISVSPAQPSLSRFSVCSLIKTFAMK